MTSISNYQFDLFDQRYPTNRWLSSAVVDIVTNEKGNISYIRNNVFDSVYKDLKIDYVDDLIVGVEIKGRMKIDFNYKDNIINEVTVGEIKKIDNIVYENLTDINSNFIFYKSKSISYVDLNYISGHSFVLYKPKDLVINSQNNKLYINEFNIPYKFQDGVNNYQLKIVDNRLVIDTQINFVFIEDDFFNPKTKVIQQTEEQDEKEVSIVTNVVKPKEEYEIKEHIEIKETIQTKDNVDQCSKESNYLIYWILILLLIVIVVGGFIYYRKKQRKMTNSTSIEFVDINSTR